MKFTNKHNLPEPLFQALTEDNHGKRGDISVTGLLKTPRQRLLAERHDDEITVDASTRLWSLLGSAVHHIIEKFGKTAEGFAEETMEEKVQGPKGIWTVSGTPDWLELRGKTLVLSDWKCVGVFAFIFAKDNGYVKLEWEQQLNIYRWMFHKRGFKIDRIEIGGMGRDWKKGDFEKKRAAGDNDYPSCPVNVYEVALWPMEEVEEFVKKRVAVHQEAQDIPDAKLPECSPADRWVRGEKWALMFKQAKRASRLFDTEHEALEFAEQPEVKSRGGRIEYRPGKANHCDPDYCHGLPWCSQVCGVPSNGQKVTA